MENEIFKDIKGYEGLYAVSNYGRVKSLPKQVFNHNGFFYRKEKIIKPGKDTKGYLRISVCLNGKQHTYKIHRLVAQAFIPNPENKPQVNHIDGNKQNNHVENLEWCTNQENQDHAWKNGLYQRKELIKYCQFCGRKLERKRFNGRLEDFGAFKKRKCCDLKCYKKSILKDLRK